MFGRNERETECFEYETIRLVELFEVINDFKKLYRIQYIPS